MGIFILAFGVAFVGVFLVMQARDQNRKDLADDLRQGRDKLGEDR